MNTYRTIKLTTQGKAKFDKWISTVGAPGLNTQVVLYEALDRFEDDLSTGQTPLYELHPRCTTTGRPEVFILKREDFTFEAP